jgi:flagellar protein FlgJ
MTSPVAPCGFAPASAPLRAAAQSFEAVFTQMLLQSLRSTVKRSDLFHGGRGEEMFAGLLDQTLARAAASRGAGLGITEMIMKQVAKSAYSG